MEFYKHSNAVVHKSDRNWGKQSGAGSTWGFFRPGTIPLLPPATEDIYQQLRASLTL